MDIIQLHNYNKSKITLPIQAIRLGAGIIGTLPGEFFSETGIKLKTNKPSKYYFTVCLANAQVGYVPPSGQFTLGGYETWISTGSHMEESAEEKIRTELSRLVKLVNQ